MARPLDQLYKTKLQLMAVLIVVAGAVVLMLARWVATLTNIPQWLHWVPLSELGATLVGTGIVAIVYEYVDRQHGDERADQRIREAVRQEAPAFRNAVLDSFAFDPDTLRSIASDEALDRITTNALGLRVGDEELARELYTDLRDQVLGAPERWHDVDVAVSLAPWNGKASSELTSMFVATIRWEYRVRPANTTMRFACVSDADEYREMLRDQAITSAWYLDPSAGVDGATIEAFELLRLTVDGETKKIRRTERAGAQVYSVSLGAALAEKEVTVAYTYRALVLRHGHLLYLDLPRPTKGLHAQLDYQSAGIRRVNTLDYFASSARSRVDQTPSSLPAKTVDVSFDGWIFPRSGVAFVWVLEDEAS
jgi:hypothetical protein